MTNDNFIRRTMNSHFEIHHSHVSNTVDAEAHIVGTTLKVRSLNVRGRWKVESIFGVIDFSSS